MSIEDIPIRSNGPFIDASWFNTIRSELLSSPANVAVVTKASDHTATASDSILEIDASGNAVDISLPSAVGVPNKQYVFKVIDLSFPATITPSGSETIDGLSVFNFTDQYESITIISNGNNWIII